METDDGAAASAQSRPPIVRLVFLAVVVALFAAIASGSCALWVSVDAIEEGRKSVAGAGALPALLSAGLALAVGLGYFRLVRRWPAAEAKLFVTISVVAYPAGMLGAWYPFVVPAVVVVIVVIAGGITAGRITRGDIADSSGIIAIVSGIAIAAATVGFVAGFWANYDMDICWLDGNCGPDTFNAIPFAIVAGSVPPICAALGARLACVIAVETK